MAQPTSQSAGQQTARRLEIFAHLEKGVGASVIPDELLRRMNSAVDVFVARRPSTTTSRAWWRG